jgi:flagella basal body P-ring formation protein FlgA
MKRRFSPILTEERPGSSEFEGTQRLLASRQSSSDRPVVRRQGTEGRRGAVLRVAHAAGLGLLSLWLGIAIPAGAAEPPRIQPRYSFLSPAPVPAPAPAPAVAVPVAGAVPVAVPIASVPNPSPALVLVESAEVDGEGIFLDQIVTAVPPSPLPHLRLAPAPTVGQVTLLTRTQVVAWIQTRAPAVTTTHWTGPEQAKVTRRTRSLDETELKELLQTTLQENQVKDRGELEIRLTRPWTSIAVADEPLTLKVVDLPASGVGANFIVRFELWAGQERLGNWQVAATAKVWREIFVAESPLKRGQLLRTAPILRERRDVLALRDVAVVGVGEQAGELELRENVAAGQPIYARSLRVRPVVFRGSVVDGMMFEGGMTITLKVEVLEDGLPGHVVRVRNPRTRREMLGKVKNEQTILIPM